MQTITVAAASVLNVLGQPDAAIREVELWSSAAREQGAELILFPELNLTGYLTHAAVHSFAETIPGTSTQRVAEIAGRLGMTIAVGLLEEEDGHYFCAHVLITGGGVIGKQRKIHVPAQERPFWEPGNSIEVFDLGKARVGITVCRDSFFDEMTRTLYFKGAEIVLMPFGYYNVPRSQYLKETIHGMSIIKASWTNGFYSLVCNSAGDREPNTWEPSGKKFPGWAGAVNPWGSVMRFIEDEGSDPGMIVVTAGPEEMEDRRSHPNFLARELRPELYRFL